MDLLNQALQLSPPFALALGLNLVGLFMKKSPIPNWTIPLSLIIMGAGSYPFIAEPGKVNYECKNPDILNAIYGACIGGLSVGMNQVFRQFKLIGGDDYEEPK